MWFKNIQVLIKLFTLSKAYLNDLYLLNFSTIDEKTSQLNQIEPIQASDSTFQRKFSKRKEKYIIKPGNVLILRKELGRRFCNYQNEIKTYLKKSHRSYKSLSICCVSISERERERDWLCLRALSLGFLGVLDFPFFGSVGLS